MQGYQEFLPEGWERSETSAGIPYYINHDEGTTHWQHPTLTTIFSELDGVNGIKYGAYRVAMKLRTVQKLTHLNEVNHKILKDSFKEIGIGPSSAHNNEVLSVEELESLLVIMFQLACTDREHQLQQENCVALALNFLLRCLDSGRTGAIKIRSLKNVLIALSQGTLEEKYAFLYQQVQTDNGVGISKTNMKILLQDLLMITDSLAEDSTFESETIDNAIENCWDLSKNQPTDTLNEEELKAWLLKEPVCLVWLPTLHRLAAAETVKHEAKCAKCKSFPIVGFRYRCLKCSNVDLCQNCFWTQKTMKNHKLTHPTREYCMATTTGDDVRDFMKQLRNKITRKYRNKPVKVNYLKYPTDARTADNRIPDQSPVFQNVHTRINLLASRLHELEEGIDYEDTSRYSPTRYSAMHASLPSSPTRSAHVRVESTSTVPPVSLSQPSALPSPPPETALTPPPTVQTRQQAVDLSTPRAPALSPAPAYQLPPQTLDSPPAQSPPKTVSPPTPAVASSLQGVLPPTPAVASSSQGVLPSARTVTSPPAAATKLSPPRAPPTVQVMYPPTTVMPVIPPPTAKARSPPPTSETAPATKPDAQSMKAKLKLESQIIELQGRHQHEAKARRQLEKELAEKGESQAVDMEMMREMKQRIHDLEKSNQLHRERISQLLATPPLTKTVRVPVAVPVFSPASSVAEARAPGVSTPSGQLTKDVQSYSLGSQTSMMGGEEEEIEAVLRDLLAAFPVQTSKPDPQNTKNEVFKSVKDVGDKLTTLVGHIKRN